MWVVPAAERGNHEGCACVTGQPQGLPLRMWVVPAAERGKQGLRLRHRATTRVAPADVGCSGGRTGQTRVAPASQGNHKGCPYGCGSFRRPNGVTMRVAPASQGNHKGCPYGCGLFRRPNGVTMRVAPASQGNHKGCPCGCGLFRRPNGANKGCACATGQPQGLPLRNAAAGTPGRVGFRQRRGDVRGEARAGEFTYECEEHPGAMGQVFVDP